jgi:hypothetical protein
VHLLVLLDPRNLGIGTQRLNGSGRQLGGETLERTAVRVFQFPTVGVHDVARFRGRGAHVVFEDHDVFIGDSLAGGCGNDVRQRVGPLGRTGRQGIVTTGKRDSG